MSSSSMSIIIRALREGQRELAVKLISSALPYQVCLYDDEGQTALHIAIQKNYIDLAQKLLEKGANINAFATDSCYGYMTPLHYAALTGNLQATKLLLTWGANRHLENKRNMTATSMAYQHGHIEVARALERGNKVQSYNWPVKVPKKAFVPFNPRPLIEDNIPYRTKPAQKQCAEYSDNVIDFLSYKRSKMLR